MGSIIHGNMSWIYKGRKLVKRPPLKRRSKPKTSSGVGVTPKPPRALTEANEHTLKYPSFNLALHKPSSGTDDSYKKEISSNYTVAVAYNKGGYQVIPKSQVKDIGRK
jgi:hypothetical protein|tara:strand:- start:208 stop:531 length:324 start_codon:yes stop_codon:yes gene_type:complete